MGTIVNICRKISLGGIIMLVLSLVLKDGLPEGKLGLFFLFSPILYLIFIFFTWLLAKAATEDISESLGVDIEANGYFVTLLRAIPLDLISPVLVIINLFRFSGFSKIIVFVSTYIIILAYVFIWFFVI